MSINKKTNNLIISKKEFFILTLLFLNPLSLDKFNINFIGLSHVILFILLIVKLNNLIYTIQKYKEFFLVSSLFIFFLILKLGFGFIFFSVNIYDYLIILNYFKVIIFIYLFFTILDKVNIIRILCYYTVLSSLWIIFSNIEFLNSNFSEKPGLVFVTNESTKNLIGFIFTQIFLISLLFFKEKKNIFILTIISLLIVIYSGSKTAILSLLLCSIIYFYKIFLEKKIINQKKLFLIFGFIIFIIFLDIYKYKEYYFSINHFHIWDTKNTLSFLDIFFIDEFFKIYSSFYQRILNVWMMGILDETNYGINPNYDLLNFLFGTYRKEYFVHDSLYFHIFYEFGLIGLFLFVFYLFKYVGVLDKKYLILIISILIFSINSEILFVSSTIDIVIIFFLVSYYKLSNIKTVKI